MVKSGIFVWCEHYRQVTKLKDIIQKYDKDCINKVLVRKNANISKESLKKEFDIVEDNHVEKIKVDIKDIKKYEKLTDFLKNSCSIDHSFIDMMFTNYHDKHNENDYRINLELIAKWLNVRKDDLKKLLVSNFIKNRDYIEQKESGKKGTGRNNLIHVLLTYNCCKRLLFISKSKKASTTQNYIFELEKLMIIYHVSK